MKHFHLAISVTDIEGSVRDYSNRFDQKPDILAPGEYAVWRTPTVNFSIRRVDGSGAPSLRHFGWQDDEAKDFSEEADTNGIVWERFSAAAQLAEVQELYGAVDHSPI